MSPTHLLERAKKLADKRQSEVIARTFDLAKRDHVKHGLIGERCECEFCLALRQYVSAKLKIFREDRKFFNRLSCDKFLMMDFHLHGLRQAKNRILAESSLGSPARGLETNVKPLSLSVGS